MKKFIFTLLATLCCVASIAQVAAITGPASFCVGTAVTFSDATGGGTWSSSNSAIATIGTVTGVATGVGIGVVTISYTVGATSATYSVTVEALPSPITGGTSVCVGSFITLSSLTPGGTWSSSSGIVSMTAGGVTTGIAAGTSVITYALATGCMTMTMITVNPLPLPITGPSAVCINSGITLSDASAGGFWSSHSPVIASVTPAGVVFGISPGPVAFDYTLSTGCFTSYSVTVNPAPTIYSVTGGGNYCSGGSGVPIGLSGSQPGINYQLSNSGVATGSPVPGTGSAITFGSITGAGTYTIIASDGTTGCDTNMSGPATVVVNSLPASYTVTGGGSYCAGGTGVPVGLAFSSPGINYQLMNGAVPVGLPVPGTGTSLSFGLQTAAGTYTMVAADVITGCVNTMTGTAVVTIAPSPTAFSVTGGGSYCSGGTGLAISLAGSQAATTYELYNGGSPTGITLPGTGSFITFSSVTAAGTYTIEANPGSGCSLAMTGSAVVIVNPLPNAYSVTGSGSYCSGGSGLSVGLSGSDAGVDYQLYYGAAAMGSPFAGTGSALSFGTMTAAGVYTIVATDAVTACNSAMTGGATITITSLPATYTVSGGGAVCSGSAVSATLSGSATGVSYQLYNGSAAVGGAMAGTGSALSFSGLTSAGTYTIVATDVTTSCTNNMTGSATVTIGSATITAGTSVACGGVNTLTASGCVSYVWVPTTGLSCTACSSTTVTPSSSVLYTVTGTDASGCTASTTVAVDGNSVYGDITYTGGSSTDVFKIWLIQFNPSDSSIVATDSMTSCMVGSAVAPFYQFMDPAPGSYMVKAELLGTTPGTSGYIPTYSSSTANWYSAASVTHSTSADAMPVTMVYGTVPSGPGFISGYVYAGAGKGTTGDAPDPGMTIYLKNASTGNVLTFTHTDATGHYSFGSLNYGSYLIYPESYKYYTTPSDVINLSTSSTSVSDINFRRSTTLGTITPKTTAIQPIPELGYYISPNPTSGDVSVTWPIIAGNANISVTDLTGRTVYNEVFNATAGKANISLGNLQNGIYFIAVTTDNYNYGTKLLIQK